MHWRGWNFVDYRNALEPHFVAFLDVTDYWEEKVRIGLGIGVSELADWDPYFSVRIDHVAVGPRRGSWRAQGIVATKLAIMEDQIKQKLSGTQGGGGPTGWIAKLPVADDVKEWVKLFVAHEYAQCASRGLSLLPRIEHFEILQMFLVSLLRLGKHQVGGGWAANEMLEQLGPQVLANHQHIPDLHSLLAITLGVLDPGAALAATQDRRVRCAIHYYAAARLISQGQLEQALAHLDRCLEAPGGGLEPHLALEEREDISFRRTCVDGSRRSSVEG